MPVSREELFSFLNQRGIRLVMPEGSDEKWVRTFARLRETYEGTDGRVHPTYSLHSTTSRIQTTTPNIFMYRLDHIQPAPGKIVLPISPAKFESVYLANLKGEAMLAKELAETQDTLGDFLLKQFGLPLDARSSRYARMVFFQGLYGKADPNTVEKHEGDIPAHPRWEEFLQKWPGLVAPAEVEFRKVQSRQAWAQISDILLRVAVEYEEKFPGTLTGIWMDTLIIECSFRFKEPIEAWLTDKFREATGYQFKMHTFGHKIVNPDDRKSKFQILFES